MDFTQRAKHVITQEAQALLSLSETLIEESLPQLADMILQSRGKVIVTGLGKNGHIAKRVAATLSCTGTPSVFLHPSESAHGDLGMISPDDILLALSNSGKTREIIETVQRVKQYYPGVKIAVVTGHPDSPLFDMADVSLCYGVVTEPCPLGLTPSSSLAVMSALLDALALGIMEARGFTQEQFLIRHHAGYLSQKIQARTEE